MYYILDKKTNRKLCLAPFKTREDAKKEIEQVKIDITGSIYSGCWDNAIIREAPKTRRYTKNVKNDTERN